MTTLSVMSGGPLQKYPLSVYVRQRWSALGVSACGSKPHSISSTYPAESSRSIGSLEVQSHRQTTW